MVQGQSFVPSGLSVGFTDQILTVDLKSLWNEQKMESETDEVYVKITLL